jgi:glycerol-3-phosphate dehydrogenase
MPLCEAVYQVLYERLPVDEVIRGLMSRPIKAETD